MGPAQWKKWTSDREFPVANEDVGLNPTPDRCIPAETREFVNVSMDAFSKIWGEISLE